MRAEYDFSKGVRGKYAGRFAEGTNVVVLLPDVSKAFPNSKAVNDALRGLMRVARSASGKPHNKGVERTAKRRRSLVSLDISPTRPLHLNSDN